MKREKFCLALLVGIATACSSPMIARPLDPSRITPPVTIAAPFDKTWDAAVSWFAERNIAIRTIDKSSGLIIVEADSAGLSNKRAKPVPKDYSSLLTFADCGTRDGEPYDPTKATYNVHLVRSGDASELQGNVKYEQDGHGVGNQYFVCKSTGKWEREFQVWVKQKAEAR